MRPESLPYCSAHLLIASPRGRGLRGRSSRKSSRQEQRGVNVVPAVPVSPTAERRIALVIGNSAYMESPLANPVNDATDTTNALQQMGFAVAPLLNADLRRMRDAVDTSASNCVRECSGSSISLGMGCRSTGKITSCRLGHVSSETRTSSLKPWMCGESSAPWKRPRMASISSSWMLAAIIPLPGASPVVSAGARCDAGDHRFAHCVCDRSRVGCSRWRGPQWCVYVPSAPQHAHSWFADRAGVQKCSYWGDARNREQADSLGIIVPDRAYHVYPCRREPRTGADKPITGDAGSGGDLFPSSPRRRQPRIVGNDGAEMVLVPAGEFSHGERCGRDRPLAAGLA